MMDTVMTVGRFQRFVGKAKKLILAECPMTLEHVQSRLNQWGECMRQSPTWGLGLPGQANFLAEHFSGFTDMPASDVPADVMEIEIIMIKLKGYNEKYYLPLEQYYLRNKSVELASRCLHMGRRAFLMNKACGEQFVAGSLIKNI